MSGGSSGFRSPIYLFHKETANEVQNSESSFFVRYGQSTSGPFSITQRRR